jgi:lysophospholipase L1-like esterase
MIVKLNIGNEIYETKIKSLPLLYIKINTLFPQYLNKIPILQWKIGTETKNITNEDWEIFSEKQKEPKEIFISFKDFKKKILIVGSSVCNGGCADFERGWAQILEERISHQYMVSNKSINGTNTTHWVSLLKRISKQNWNLESKPDILIVGLSLANEGIFEDTYKYKNQFLEGLNEISSICQEFNVQIMLGGVYPNNEFDKNHYKALKEVNEIMKKRALTFDFLSLVDDGKGHWKTGMYEDSGHPNTFGHETMFKAIDLKLFLN